jgi:hypothetical protein
VDDDSVASTYTGRGGAGLMEARWREGQEGSSDAGMSWGRRREREGGRLRSRKLPGGGGEADLALGPENEGVQIGAELARDSFFSPGGEMSRSEREEGIA